jgi:hypothetical protein
MVRQVYTPLSLQAASTSDGAAAAAAASQARRHVKSVLSVRELPAARLVAARAEAFGGARNRCADTMGTHHWHCSRMALTAHEQRTSAWNGAGEPAANARAVHLQLPQQPHQMSVYRVSVMPCRSGATSCKLTSRHLECREERMQAHLAAAAQLAQRSGVTRGRLPTAAAPSAEAVAACCGLAALTRQPALAARGLHAAPWRPELWVDLAAASA